MGFCMRECEAHGGVSPDGLHKSVLDRVQLSFRLQYCIGVTVLLVRSSSFSDDTQHREASFVL